ncbi:Uncharacterised protein [Mycobacteroides abscessus subsp. abscessus]|nr:Uncharacterised protein [Mycobacteroides abscessus subsp. abscessus]
MPRTGSRRSWIDDLGDCAQVGAADLGRRGRAWSGTVELPQIRELWAGSRGLAAKAPPLLSQRVVVQVAVGGHALLPVSTRHGIAPNAAGTSQSPLSCWLSVGVYSVG